jgi:PAS domain S-box-containing protein
MNKQVENLLQSLADGVLLVDRQGIIRFVNESATELFGYEPGELVDQAIEELVPESERDPHKSMRDKFQASPEARRMGRRTGLVARRKDGGYFKIDVSLSPVELDGTAYVLALARNVERPGAADADDPED